MCKSVLRFRPPTDVLRCQARIRCDCSVVELDLAKITAAADNPEIEKVLNQWGEAAVAAVLAVIWPNRSTALAPSDMVAE